ncbi:glutathione S-transferase family protein [Polaromonas sp.]|uniref:glutathione S-transferase family protein n=1 Tax=Polaromonas sp. TaxID=1869339 RepID=UPI002FC84FE2
MKTVELTLISHTLCPYVQRAAIVLAEKGVAFERRDVDLANKPDWFKAVSPLGKTPVLLVGEQPIFESAVICEYLDETVAPPLHPGDALQRAQHRAWMEFGSAVLGTIWGFYTAPDATALQARREELLAKFAQIEQVLPSRGPYFAGEKFGLVDAVFGPVFRYFDVFEQIGQAGFFDATPKLHAWRSALAQRPSVQQAASAQYPELLRQFLLARNSELSRRML